MTEDNFEGVFKPLPQSQPTNIDQYTERANPMLEEHGRQIVKKSQYDLMRWGLYVFIGIAVVLAYAVFTDSFKSTINNSCPQITIPECPNITCPTNNVVCADNICNVTCPSFPTTLNITIRNNTI